MPDRHLAAAPDFSPGIVGDIRALLLLVLSAQGRGREHLIEAVREAHFTATAATQQSKRANNVLIGLREYGLLDDARLTPFGEELARSADYETAFARHILLDLHGMDLLRAITDLQRQGRTVQKDSLAEELRSSFGFEMPRDTTKHMTMLNWLRPSGVFGGSSGFEVDDEAVNRITSLRVRDVDDWQLMPLRQRAFIEVLRRITQDGQDQAVPVKAVLDLAEQEFGRLYVGGQTAKSVIAPLVAAGWIATTGTTQGRGARSGSVSPTSRLKSVDLALLQGFHTPPIPPDLRAQMNKPLSTIAQELGEADKFVAGIALELLALRMSISLGLTPIELRKRDDKTGGGEVDLLAEGVHLHHSRWLFQCKNQRQAVTVSTLAKEIGMAVLLRAHVIVIATTSRFTSAVHDHARQVAESTAMQVVLVDGDSVRRYLRSGDEQLRRYFHDCAAATLVIKQGQREATAGD